MDAETRHELKRNELADAIEKLPRLNDPRVQWAIAGVVVVIVAIVAWNVWRYNRDVALSSAWYALVTASASDDAVAKLESLLASSTDARFEAACRVRLAQALLDRADSEPAQHRAAWERVAEVLERVDRDSPPAVLGPALFMLATVQESLGRVSEAEQNYRLLAEPRFDGSPYQTQAGERQNSVDEVQVRLELQPGSAPPEPELVGPPELPRMPVGMSGMSPMDLRGLSQPTVEVVEVAEESAGEPDGESPPAEGDAPQEPAPQPEQP